MLKIQTGRGTIPLNVLVAIWSVSAVVSLPGLAISPILGDLDKIFKHATDLEIQMLTSLPSLLIIPFVLLAGKLSVSRNKLLILYTGLIIFFVSGLSCLFVGGMTSLIVVNGILGIGAGMVVPLSTGLVADYFSAAARPAARDQLGDQQRDARAGHVADRLAGDDRLALSLFGLSVARRFAAADAYLEKSALAGCDIRFRSGSFSDFRRRVRYGRSCRCLSVFRFFRRRFAFAIVRRGGGLVRF